MTRSKDTWPIVLAGGDGRRLYELTRRESGAPRPKQFWSLRGGRSLLATTLERARRLAGPEKIVTVVAAQHEGWWRPELDHLSAANVVVQPENRGTAVGLLLPLLAVLRRDPEAQVVVLPSDHFVAEEAVLHRAIRRVLAALDVQDGAPILLGISPDHPDPELGWLVPRPGVGVVAVERFVEKPSVEDARRLLSQGGLWNSFILVAKGQQLLEIFERTLPEIVEAFVGATCDRDLEKVYASLPARDFSRDVLQTTGSENLKVYAVPSCGWSDLGTPQRVADVRRRFPMDKTYTGLAFFFSHHRIRKQDRAAGPSLCFQSAGSIGKAI